MWNLYSFPCKGREWSDWSQELRIPGEELRWKFTSDGSVNGWGWLLTVYPIMPAAAPQDMLSDRTILSRPSIDLVTCLLDCRLEAVMDPAISPRLAASLAACAQLSCLSELLSPSHVGWIWGLELYKEDMHLSDIGPVWKNAYLRSVWVRAAWVRCLHVLTEGLA